MPGVSLVACLFNVKNSAIEIICAKMTLPEALLKRLAKRGIIPDAASKTGSAAVGETQAPKSTVDGDSDRELERESDHSSDRETDDNRSNNDEIDDDRRESEIVNEEIIAEDYDEYDQVNPESFEYASKKKSNPALDWTEKMKQKMTKRYGYQSVDGCQNKYNIYHLCTMYCVKRYGEVEFEIEKEYEKRVKRLLERYPLPKHWRKEYDIGCRAFYFYNKETRVVSWLPPTHPDAKLTKSAKLLRRELMEEQKRKDAANESIPPTVVVETYPPSAVPPPKALIGPTNTAVPVPPTGGAVASGGENLRPPVVNPPKRPPIKSTGREDEKRPRTFSTGNDSGDGSMAADSIDRERDFRDRNRDRRDRERDRRDRDRSPPPARGDDTRFGARERTRDRDRDRDRDHRDHRDHRRPPRGGPPRSAPLDPMDPAAYSDIPRGTWSAGLETAATGTKKEKEERKKQQQQHSKASKDDTVGDDDDGTEGAHEVLKISAVKEFHQHEGGNDGEDDDDDDDDADHAEDDTA
uniref:WW domain-containing protein n=1 Tax=Anopheles farauti TaxID=69004 RepID=A0A182QAJ1_9DIPT